LSVSALMLGDTGSCVAHCLPWPVLLIQNLLSPVPMLLICSSKYTVCCADVADLQLEVHGLLGLDLVPDVRTGQEELVDRLYDDGEGDLLHDVVRLLVGGAVLGGGLIRDVEGAEADVLLLREFDRDGGQVERTRIHLVGGVVDGYRGLGRQIGADLLDLDGIGTGTLVLDLYRECYRGVRLRALLVVRRRQADIVELVDDHGHSSGVVVYAVTRSCGRVEVDFVGSLLSVVRRGDGQGQVDQRVRVDLRVATRAEHVGPIDYRVRDLDPDAVVAVPLVVQLYCIGDRLAGIGVLAVGTGNGHLRVEHLVHVDANTIGVGRQGGRLGDRLDEHCIGFVQGVLADLDLEFDGVLLVLLEDRGGFLEGKEVPSGRADGVELDRRAVVPDVLHLEVHVHRSFGVQIRRGRIDRSRHDIEIVVLVDGHGEGQAAIGSRIARLCKDLPLVIASSELDGNLDREIDRGLFVRIQLYARGAEGDGTPARPMYIGRLEVERILTVAVVRDGEVETDDPCLVLDVHGFVGCSGRHDLDAVVLVHVHGEAEVDRDDRLVAGGCSIGVDVVGSVGRFPRHVDPQGEGVLRVPGDGDGGRWMEVEAPVGGDVGQHAEGILAVPVVHDGDRRVAPFVRHDLARRSGSLEMDIEYLVHLGRKDYGAVDPLAGFWLDRDGDRNGRVSERIVVRLDLHVDDPLIALAQREARRVDHIGPG